MINVMKMRKKKIAQVIFLILSMLLIIFGCRNLKPNIKSFLKNGENFPVRSMKISLDVSRREELFNQMKEFSDKNKFEFNLIFYDVDKLIFLVDIYGDSFNVTAGDVPESPKEIMIAIYDEPFAETPNPNIDGIFSDLKTYIMKIPGIIVLEEK